VHVRLAERGLANSRIGIVVPADGRPPSLAARLAVDHIRDRLNEFARALAAPQARPKPAKRRRAS